MQEQTDKYIDNDIRQTEALLALYLDLGFQKGLPSTCGWAASPDFLMEIGDYALTKKPKVIVECGSGVSTIILAKCLQKNGSGHLYSLKYLSEFAGKSRDALTRHGLTEWATIIYASLKTINLNGGTWIWYSADDLPVNKIDMPVIDGPPGNTAKMARYPAGPILFDRLQYGGSVFLDDASRSEEKEIVKLWLKESPYLQHKFRELEKGCSIITIQK